MDLMSIMKNENNDEEHRTIVRLTTSYWLDNRGLHCKKDIALLKRLSKGYNIIYEEASNAGAAEAYTMIDNIDNCTDGIYEVIICNEYRDRETGYVEDYDIRLIQYDINKNPPLK